MRRFHLISAGLLTLSLAAAAPGQTFTYQGTLMQGGLPAEGAQNLQFKLFDAPAGGNQIGATVTQNGVQVVEGQFMAQLGFGAAAFNGADRWLEISVNGTLMSPRTRVTPAPMAIH